MYLVADNSLAEAPSAQPFSFAQWADFPVSYLSHHGEDCCETARLWFRAMDFAQLNGGDTMSGPRWIRQRYDWGPSRWPLHWCEALKVKVIDCGAHSALAHDAFEARGLTSFRAQFVQSYGSRAVDQWRTRWSLDEASDHWLGDGFIYHEGNAVLMGPDEVKLWDGSAGCWLNPGHVSGYGSILAVRISMEISRSNPSAVQWGSHRLIMNEWTDLCARPSSIIGS